MKKVEVVAAVIRDNNNILQLSGVMEILKMAGNFPEARLKKEKRYSKR